MLDLAQFDNVWVSSLPLLSIVSQMSTSEKWTAREQFASEWCCVSNTFFQTEKIKTFQTASINFDIPVPCTSETEFQEKAPRPKYLSITQLMPLESQEVKGAMKLSLLRRRSCYKNAKGQRYLGVGENNSLTLAFRNICSQSVAKRSLKLPAKPSHMVGLWIIQRERRKRKLFIKFTFRGPWIAWNNYQVIINLLNVLVLRSEAET